MFNTAKEDNPERNVMEQVIGKMNDRSVTKEDNRDGSLVLCGVVTVWSVVPHSVINF